MVSGCFTVGLIQAAFNTDLGDFPSSWKVDVFAAPPAVIVNKVVRWWLHGSLATSSEDNSPGVCSTL